MFRLDGKLALVTGGSRGIGRAICLALAEQGAVVGINYRKEEEKAQKVRGLIVEKGGRAELFKGDVSVRSEAEDVVKRFVGAFGGIEILVNNAGVRDDVLFPRVTADRLERVMQVNFNGAYYMTKATVPHLLKRKWGRIIFLSSVAPFLGSPGQTSYSASKAAVVGFAHSLARELASRNITVNAVAPGITETEFTQGMTEQFAEIVKSNFPIARFAKPEEVAAAVVYLASDEAAYMTGTTIHLNGGGYMS